MDLFENVSNLGRWNLRDVSQVEALRRIQRHCSGYYGQRLGGYSHYSFFHRKIRAPPFQKV